MQLPKFMWMPPAIQPALPNFSANCNPLLVIIKRFVKLTPVFGNASQIIVSNRLVINIANLLKNA